MLRRALRGNGTRKRCVRRGSLGGTGSHAYRVTLRSVTIVRLQGGDPGEAGLPAGRRTPTSQLRRRSLVLSSSSLFHSGLRLLA